MKTSMINVRLDPDIKKGAEAIAASLGLTLSEVVDTYLKSLVRRGAPVVFQEDDPLFYRKK